MKISEIGAFLVMALGLLYLAIEDLKHKKISLFIIIAMGVLLMGLSIWQKNGVGFIMLGLIPGALAIIFSLITKGSFGLGDAILLLATGVYLGVWDGIAVLMYGLLLSSLVGIFLLCLKKAGLKSEMPFVPFYLLGFIIWGVVKWAF